MLGPNITGTWTADFGFINSVYAGAYYKNTAAKGLNHGGANADNTATCKTPNFEAKRSNAIYGGSTTVQPNSTTALILIKF